MVWKHDRVSGADGKPRCGWVSDDPLYQEYHDTEWGRPLRDDRALFELLTERGAAEARGALLLCARAQLARQNRMRLQSQHGEEWFPQSWDWRIDERVAGALGSLGGLAALTLFLSPVCVSDPCLLLNCVLLRLDSWIPSERWAAYARCGAHLLSFPLGPVSARA